MNAVGWTLPAALLMAALPLSAQAHEGEAHGDEGHGPDVVSFDWGSADTLVALGLEDHLVGLPQRSAPAYLAEQLAGSADVGGLKTPDIDAVAELDPDLILVTGRQASALEDLQAIAETRDVTLAEGDYFDALSDKVMGLAAPFGAEAERLATERLAALHADIEAARASLPDDLEAVMVTHNDGHYGLRRSPVVEALLDIDRPAVPDSVEPVSHGPRTFYPVNPAQLAEMAPDELFVVDRSAAIGQTPLDVAELKDALAAEGGEAIDVTVLSPALWYLSGDGLESVRAQVDEVVESL